MSGGTSRRVAEREFEQTARLRWERDYGDYGEDEEDIEQHAEVVRRLFPRGFVIRRPPTSCAFADSSLNWAPEGRGSRKYGLSKNTGQKPAYSQSMMPSIFSVFGSTMMFDCDKSQWQNTKLLSAAHAADQVASLGKY